MPSPEIRRRGGVQDKDRKGKLTENVSSFQEKGSAEEDGAGIGRRGENRRLIAAADLGRPRKFTKLLVNVTVERSLGAVQVLIPPEVTVEALIAAALRQYMKEARRPVLRSAVASEYDLHYSQFSLESLDRKEKLMELGSRSFFLWPRKASAAAAVAARLSEKVDAAGDEKGLPCFKFINFFL